MTPARAASGACALVHALLAGRASAPDAHSGTCSEEMIDAVMLRVSELVAVAARHADREVEVICRIDNGRDSGTEIEVICRVNDARWPLTCPPPGTSPPDGKESGATVPVPAQPTGRRAHCDHTPAMHNPRGGPAEYTMRLRLRQPPPNDVPPSRPAAARAPLPAGPQPAPAAPRAHHDHLGPFFLAEASELLAGQLDENLVAAVAGQLLVPRVADWCGVWLTGTEGTMRLARVWHAQEHLIDPLRTLLAHNPPAATPRASQILLPTASVLATDAAFALPLSAGRSCHGMLVIGVADRLQADGVLHQVENLARLIAQAVCTARQYAQQTTISQALQRHQLPASLPFVPGIDVAIAYEPREQAQTVGGDFYDLFHKGNGRWCFLLGDVQGKDPEAMSLTGLARHTVRLLAREGHSVETVLERLNITLADESAEAGAELGRFLTMLYGELEADLTSGKVHCRLASAGHPLPLRLSTDGTVEPAAQPQLLLGVDRSARFGADHLVLLPDEVLLCVTDGVTERRRGNQLFDDADGLAAALSRYTGMSAVAVANQVRQAVHDFSLEPIQDDLAVMALKALPPQE
ncbi:PP2C family protein-serine/threonine phosphatase [Streptomyces sp. NPDC048191]|uniref:PP2C family protein-serine/threonine phosphatase n=1 Tax=Streptomyces sp. NPDC048191 TaxID=3155484 RepID=UPI0033E8315E